MKNTSLMANSLEPPHKGFDTTEKGKDCIRLVPDMNFHCICRGDKQGLRKTMRARGIASNTVRRGRKATSKELGQSVREE